MVVSSTAWLDFTRRPPSSIFPVRQSNMALSAAERFEVTTTTDLRSMASLSLCAYRVSEILVTSSTLISLGASTHLASFRGFASVFDEACGASWFVSVPQVTVFLVAELLPVSTDSAGFLAFLIVFGRAMVAFLARFVRLVAEVDVGSDGGGFFLLPLAVRGCSGSSVHGAASVIADEFLRFRLDVLSVDLPRPDAVLFVTLMLARLLKR